MIRRSLRSTPTAPLFPYTTLLRSLASKHYLCVVAGFRQRFPEPRTALQVHLFPHAGIIEQRKVRLDLPVYGYPEGVQRSRVDVHFHDDLGRGLAYIANAVSGASELSHQLSVGRLHHEGLSAVRTSVERRA